MVLSISFSFLVFFSNSSCSLLRITLANIAVPSRSMWSFQSEKITAKEQFVVGSTSFLRSFDLQENEGGWLANPRIDFTVEAKILPEFLVAFTLKTRVKVQVSTTRVRKETKTTDNRGSSLCTASVFSSTELETNPNYRRENDEDYFVLWENDIFLSDNFSTCLLSHHSLCERTCRVHVRGSKTDILDTFWYSKQSESLNYFRQEVLHFLFHDKKSKHSIFLGKIFFAVVVFLYFSREPFAKYFQDHLILLSVVILCPSSVLTHAFDFDIVFSNRCSCETILTKKRRNHEVFSLESWVDWYHECRRGKALLVVHAVHLMNHFKLFSYPFLESCDEFVQWNKNHPLFCWSETENNIRV